MMQAYFFEIDERWERALLERELGGIPARYDSAVLTAETAQRAADAEAVSVFIHSEVDAATLDRLPRLRLLVTRSTGLDHVDLSACAERGVTVCNVPRYGENTVAEHTFGLILNLSRKIYRAVERTRSCEFSLDGLEGMDLRGKVLGVVGAGAIGLHVIRIARAFGMDVVAYDVAPQSIMAEVLGFRYVALDELLAASDVVTLHVPATAETHHLLDRDRFRRMKRGAILINTARGSVVDTEALLGALDEGIVAGAGLDVLEGEELLSEEHHAARTASTEAQLRELLCEHALLDREDVIVTPHMAWYSREARERILRTTAGSIRAFAVGHPVHTVLSDR